MYFSVISSGERPLGTGRFVRCALSRELPKGEYGKNSLRLGVFCDAREEEGFILTHDVSMRRCALPYAFPAIVSRLSCGKEAYYVAFVGDYFKTSAPLRTAVRERSGGGYFIGLSNDAFAWEGGSVAAAAHVALFPAAGNSFLRVIRRCAKLYYRLHPPRSAGRAPVFGAVDFTGAARGLKENLLDARATMHDGVGVYNPYAYHEDDVYTEAFAALDVAKGMYRYAVTHKDEEAEAQVFSVADRIACPDGEYRWIEPAHNTQGFFHHVWGALPQGAALVNGKNAPRKGMFSDFDAFEEGENLFSTFKYYDRVFHLGELALLSGRQAYRSAFLRALPFVSGLHLPRYGQPVTYDLDTHEPKTGREEGGSAGGAALWAEIHFLAWKLTGDRHWLHEGLKGLDACNRLDYTHMYSMRTSPKPIALGWCVRANLDAYRITGKRRYLSRMREAAGGIFAHYYLDTNPHTFFAANGFGYACACERWEAFLEMAQSLWLLSGALPLLGDAALCRLFADAANTYLWALPVNAQPYGNLAAGYDSIGAEYVPYEYTTGHQGDNTTEWGGSQSCARQTKEIYGSGELFLLEEILEGHARSFDAHVLLVCSDPADLYGSEEGLHFCVYSAHREERAVPVAFRLPAGRYRIECGAYAAVYDARRLEKGVALPVPPQKPLPLRVLRIGEEAAEAPRQGSLSCRLTCPRELLRLRCEEGAQVYALFLNGVRAQAGTEGAFTAFVCREHPVRVRVEAYGEEGTRVYEEVLPPYRKRFLYRSDLSGKDFYCEGLTAKTDGHCCMFYAEQTPCRGRVRFCGVGGGIFALRIGALNAYTRLRAVLAEGKKKTVLLGRLTEAGLYEFDLTAADRGAAVELLAEGKTGGFLLCGAESYLPVQEEAPAWNFTGEGDRAWEAELSPDLPFAEFTVAQVGEGGEVRFYLDGEELFTPAERAYPHRVYRKNRNVYKFPVTGTGRHAFCVRFTKGGVLRSAKLTAEGHYPYRHLEF